MCTFSEILGSLHLGQVHLLLQLFSFQEIDVGAFFGSPKPFEDVRHLPGVILLIHVLCEVLIIVNVVLAPILVLVVQFLTLDIVRMHYLHDLRVI